MTEKMIKTKSKEFYDLDLFDDCFGSLLDLFDEDEEDEEEGCETCSKSSLSDDTIEKAIIMSSLSSMSFGKMFFSMPKYIIFQHEYLVCPFVLKLSVMISLLYLEINDNK